MQDQKKVGPNLKDVRLKLRKEWIPVWLQDPQAFRPGTKMPTFWRFAVPERHGRAMRDKDGQDQIKAIAAYLWQDGFDGKLPQQQQGDAGHGKELFESRAVSPVTRSAKRTARSAERLPRTCNRLARKQTSITSCAGFTIRANAVRLIVRKRNVI